MNHSMITPKSDMCGAARDVRFGSKADIRAAKCHVRFTPESGHLLAKRFNELPKFDCFFRAGAVPIVPIAFTLWRTATSAMHPTHLPASHRWRTATLPRSL